MIPLRHIQAVNTSLGVPRRAKLEFHCWIDSPHAMYDYLIGCGILVYTLRHVSQNTYSLAHCDGMAPVKFCA